MHLKAARYGAANHGQRLASSSSSTSSFNPMPVESSIGVRRSSHLPIDKRSGSNNNNNNNADGFSGQQVHLQQQQQQQPTDNQTSRLYSNTAQISQFTANGNGGSNIVAFGDPRSFSYHPSSLWPAEYLNRQVSLLGLKQKLTAVARAQSNGRASSSGNKTNGNAYASSAKPTAILLTPESLPTSQQVSLNQLSRQTGGVTNLSLFKKQTNWPVSQSDTIRHIEMVIINLVEQSARQASEPEGLSKAREAQRSLESLKMQLSDWQASELPFPLTNCPRVLELALMVQCNLAARLADQQDREAKLGAVEIYTQLCKLASNSTGQSEALIRLAGSTKLAASTGGHSAQHQEARFALHRLGLNMGNLFYQLGDQQRALRHYRLTLDRFSALESYGQLKVKLLHNISVVLMQSQQVSATIRSLGQLLVSDQLLVDQEQQIGSQKSLSAAGKEADWRRSYTSLNVNHHLFGLNLALCHYQQADSDSMIKLLRDLVRVDICHHFVSDKQPIEQHPSNRPGEVSLTRGRQSAPLTVELDSHSNLLTGRGRTATGVSRNNRRHDKQEHDFQQVSGIRETVANGELAIEGETDASGGEESRQISSSLERLIGSKREEIAQCLLTICNLILELENRKRDDGKAKETGKTSAFHVCSEIFVESENYAHLVDDLKTNTIGQLLERRAGLNEAIDVLKDICEPMGAQQVAASVVEQGSQLTNGNQPIKRPFSSSSAVIAGRANQSRQINKPATSGGQILKLSLMVANNASLFYRLRGRTGEALKFAQFALEADERNHIVWLNLANCHYELADYNAAQGFYLKALSLNPGFWQASYNMVLVNRKLGRHYDQLTASTKTHLARDFNRQSKLPMAVYHHRNARQRHQANIRMLSTIQMALM